MCGADQQCHAPGGRFKTESAAIPFEVQGFGITDINGDGIGDVVALGGTSFTMRFGNAAGTLVDSVTTTSPQILAQPAVTHLDPDPTLDLVIPTNDGLLAYTSPAHVPSPYPFPIDITPSAGQAVPLYAFPIAGRSIGVVVNTSGQLGVAVIDGGVRTSAAIASAFALAQPVCAGITSFTPNNHDDYVTASTHLVAITGDNGTICEIEVTNTGTITSHLAVGATPTASTHALFAHLAMTSPCPSLLVVTSLGPPSPTTSQLPGSGLLGSCSTGAATTLSMFPGVPIGHVELDPTVPEAVVTDAGIFAIDVSTGAPTRQYYQATRPLTGSTTVDINGDGALDVIASSDAFDDLDVLVRYGSGTTGGFLPRSIDTVGVPLNVVTGDFDGDGVGDVTYTEKLPPIDGKPVERLMVAFGGHDEIEAPRFVSSFSEVLQTVSLNLPTSSDPNGDRVRDLIALDRPTGPDSQTVLFTVLFGNPERTLLPFFDPRTSTVGTQGFRAVMAGSFAESPGQYRDMFAVEVVDTNNVFETIAYYIQADALGAMSAAPAFKSPQLFLCDPTTPKSGGLCIGDTHLTTYRPNAGEARDLIFGFDTNPAYNAVVFDPHDIASGTLAVESVSLFAQGLVTSTGLVPARQYVADIDGDGTNEVITGYGPLSGNPELGVLVRCSAGDSGPACQAIASSDLDGWSCVDTEPANVTLYQRFVSPAPRSSQDLVAVCRQPGLATAELFHIWFDSGVFHASAMFPIPLATEYATVGDVTGDGIDDVLIFEASSPVPILHVYPQCTSREYAGCPHLDGEPK